MYNTTVKINDDGSAEIITTKHLSPEDFAGYVERKQSEATQKRIDVDSLDIEVADLQPLIQDSIQKQNLQQTPVVQVTP